jgi:undecaprenyl phosphate-alpha-L-ara4N flippase subunit ArnE
LVNKINKKENTAGQNQSNKVNQENQARLSSIALMVVCTVFTSLGQLFLKLGANKLQFSLQGVFLNLPLVAGIIFYAIGAVLLIYSLKKANLSFIYPFVSLSFIWVSLLSYFFLGESMSFIQLLGIPCIILGVSLIGGAR